MGFKVTKNTLSTGLAEAVKELRAEVVSAMGTVMEEKRIEVVKRTPVLRGILRGTIRMKGPTVRGKRIEAEITAGGPSASYAIVQHEDLTFKHTVGQAKYIESVILESARTIGHEIQALVKLK